MEQARSHSLIGSDGVVVSYTLLRHVGLMLDELSAQGLEVWQDKGQAWYWQWSGTSLVTKRGMWALGEAVVDAVITRYPEIFRIQGTESAE
jgi:hypothetical protein